MSRKTGLAAILIVLTMVTLIAVLSQTLKYGSAKTDWPDFAGRWIGGKNTGLNPYRITKKTYSAGRMKINYPRITGLKNLEQQSAINKLLRVEALKVLRYYTEVEQSYTLEIDYHPKLISKNLLSVVYAGIGYAEGAAYPNNLFYTINIDIKESNRLRLPDLVKIDQDLVKMFQTGKLKALKPEHNELYNSFSTGELLEKLNRADSVNGFDASEAFSYLTKDSLGISLIIPHALGDHAEFEIKFRAITNHLKIKTKI